MSKVLKITKTDKTVHVVPTDNLAFYQAYNNRLPQEQRWKLEEIEEKDAKDLPFIDESFVTPLEAQAKVGDLQKDIEAKAQAIADREKEIEDLKAKLEEKPAPQPKFPAEMLVNLISVATTLEQVEALSKDDKRTTVIAAADKRKAELTPAN
jgi:hypothetical protein